MEWNNIFKFSKKPRVPSKPEPEPVVSKVPGRTSVPEDSGYAYGANFKKKFINPSYRSEVITILRQLYKVNPDVGIAVQDMMKLANTGHNINFGSSSDEEASKMRNHINTRAKTWSTYNGGINGLVNRIMVQTLVTGAISVEAVPNRILNGLSTVVLVNPENIRFQRKNDGVYVPYQIVRNQIVPNKDNIVKLNTKTYFYVSMFNDVDEPYGIPPFMSALDSVDGQTVMKTNFKQLMEQAGLLGFMEATIQKTPKRASESETAYATRLEDELTTFKKRIKDGMMDGVLVGHIDDHEFKFNSTTKEMQNVDKFWNMNQQSIANGLGISSSLIGVQSSTTEGAAGINLSKLISQLKNLQMICSYALEKIYTLELHLAGFKPDSITVNFNPSTISDELKVQQGVEIKLRNLNVLYQQGIISQQEYAWLAGFSKPYLKEPLTNPSEDIDETVKKETREKDKDTSDRGSRDKSKVVPKRKDQDPKPRTK